VTIVVTLYWASRRFSIVSTSVSRRDAAGSRGAVAVSAALPLKHLGTVP